MLYPQLEQRLQASKQAVNRATSESIVEQCKQYLALLAEYRSQLFELQGTPGVSQQSASPSLTEEVADRVRLQRVADRRRSSMCVDVANLVGIDLCVANRVAHYAETALVFRRWLRHVVRVSFTTVSGYEAVEIFNRRKFEGHDDWELRASGVKFPGGDNSDLMTVQEAVNLAGMLRREDHVAQNAL